jgi:hypothetical protein
VAVKQSGRSMIQSFFLLSPNGYGFVLSLISILPWLNACIFQCSEIMIEKHWRAVTPRVVCEDFWEQMSNYDSKNVSVFLI